MKKIGLIINPIAGLGGSVGLKGTDNVYKKAIALGAKPKAIERTKKVLEKINMDKIEMFYTASNNMGEDLLKELGISHSCVYNTNKKTTYKDTLECAKILSNKEIDLLIFVGGDGTARDIYNGFGEEKLAIGIPAGVKIQSAVFAKNLVRASNLINLFLEDKVYSKKCEVQDLDEILYKKGEVSSKLYGYLNIPYDKKFLQSKKSRSPLSEEGNQREIAKFFCNQIMEKNKVYLIGPGSTTKYIMENLKLKNTLIGVDIIFNGKVLKNDCGEKDILKILDKHRELKIVVTPIGGQGHIFGRGNQQISKSILEKIEKKDIIIIATKNKLANLCQRKLFLDTGDYKLNQQLKGYYSVFQGYNEKSIIKVSD